MANVKKVGRLRGELGDVTSGICRLLIVRNVSISQSLPGVIISQMDGRLGALEDTVVNAIKTSLQAQQQSPPAYEPRWISSVRHIASPYLRVSSCRPGCVCSCHSISSYSLRFTSFQSLLGSTVVSYFGRSVSSGACTRCGTRQSKSLGLVYHFPSWIVRASLTILCSTNLNGAPQMTLRVVNRLPGHNSPQFIAGLYGRTRVGDIDGVRELLSRGQVSVHDTTDAGSGTVLQFAMRMGHIEIVRLLLAAGADPYNGLYDDGLNHTAPAGALRYFASGVDGRTVDQFSDLFSLSDYVEHANYNSLHLAALGILHLNLSDLLQEPQYAGCVNQRAEDYLTPLDAAAISGNSGVVESLLRVGADVSNCMTLDMACYYNHLDVVELLIQAGASVSLRDRGGRTALIHAVCNGNSDPEILRLLIQHGSDVNDALASGGAPPLAYAAMTGNLAAGRVLLENGAEIDQREDDGDTAIVAAIAHLEHQFVRLLLQHGCDLLNVNNDGENLLHKLAAYADAEMAIIFALEAGPRMRELSTSSTDAHGRTPLQILAERNPNRELRKAFDMLLDSVEGEAGPVVGMQRVKAEKDSPEIGNESDEEFFDAREH
ncbi:ankyrin repeat-containing domain protein [Echria macrotheca]|uniref:Ankyrin repeat-containing domain protein n=1 Tax=Echria macrotheca TaxID=438768 RepID=A0AAJ0B417_9PEZI|nr:ankyrin repeat-containing domain protein [Echria macrotheca]